MEERAKLILADRQKTLELLNEKVQEYEAHITSLETEKTSAEGQKLNEITAQIKSTKAEKTVMKHRITSIQKKIQEENKMIETFESMEVELEEKTEELNSIKAKSRRYSSKQNKELDRNVKARISRLETALFNCSNRMREYKINGAYQQEALEHKMYYELISQIAKLKQVSRNEYREELIEKEIEHIKTEMKKISAHFARSRLSTEKNKDNSNKKTINGKRGTKGKKNKELPKENSNENRREIYMEDLKIEIARLQEEVRKSQAREQEYRTAPDINMAEQGIARERSERNALLARISELSKLDKQIEASAARMAEYKRNGATEQEAYEEAEYAKLVASAQKALGNEKAPETKNKKAEPKKDNTKWHSKLTPEQIEELKSEGIEPGDEEYDRYLWDHGINPTIKDMDDVRNTANGKKWHSKLTPEQIEELKSEGIEPGDEEYDRYLWDHGINPTIKDKDDSRNNNNTAGQKADRNSMPSLEDELKKRGITPPDEPFIQGQGGGKGITPPEEPFIEGPGKDDPPPPPKSNLPLTSGLQVYREVLNEIGPIKGTRAIKAHDWCRNHLKFFGVGPAIAAVIRGVTGRKKEIKRIEGILDDLTTGDDGKPDYSKLDLMLDDFLIRGKSTRKIIQVKSNDIFLRALHNKILRDATQRLPQYEKTAAALWENIQNLSAQKATAKPEDIPMIEQKIAILTDAYGEAKLKGEELNERARLVERGREEKSLDYKNNIQGADEGVRDPDNREEINVLADIDKKRLDAISRGDVVDELNYIADMEAYMASQTIHEKASLGGTRSVGKFEAPSGKIQNISDRKYKFVKTATALAQGGVVAGFAFKRSVDRMLENAGQPDISNVQQQIQNAQRQVDAQTQRLNQASASVQKIKGSVTGADVQNVQKSVYQGSLTTQEAGERSSSLIGHFNEQSQAYIKSDSTNVARANSAIANARVQESAMQNGSKSPLGKLADLFDFKAKETQGRAQLMNEYGQNARNYYSNGQNLISKSGGVDHIETAVIEGDASAIDNAQGTLYDIAGSVMGQIDKLNIAPGQKIDLSQIDLSSIISACREQGIDWFNVIAPVALGTTHTIQENKKQDVEREQ